MIHKLIGERFRRGSRVGKVLVFQSLLALVAITGFAVLGSPSTITFFALEVSVALTGGFYLGLRGQARRSARFTTGMKEIGLPSRSGPDVPGHAGGSLLVSAGPETNEPDESASGIGRRNRIFSASSSLFLITLSLAFLDLSQSRNSRP